MTARLHAATFSARPLAELMLSAATPASLSSVTWSCISATSGDTTTVSPSLTSAGTWKQSDLPEPVGITASTLRPARSASITASWPGRNASNPNTVPSTRRAAFIGGATAAAFHSASGTALRVNQRLGFIHHSIVACGGVRIVQGFPDLGSEPGVVGVRVHGQAGGHAAFGGNAGQQDAHRIRDRETNARKCLGRLGLEPVVHTDVKHRGVSCHHSLLLRGQLYLN